MLADRDAQLGGEAALVPARKVARLVVQLGRQPERERADLGGGWYLDGVHGIPSLLNVNVHVQL